MKPWPIFFLVCSTACQSPPSGSVAIRPMPSTVVPADGGIRSGERLRAFQVGRYVDANNHLLLHEQHTLYRIEAGPAWDLHPGPSCPGPATNIVPLKDAAHVPAPANDELV